jgi:hypothetical protein
MVFMEQQGFQVTFISGYHLLPVGWGDKTRMGWKAL